MTWPNPSMTRWLLNSRRSTTGDLRRIPVHEIAVHGLTLGGTSFGWQWNRHNEVTASIGARVQGGERDALLTLDFALNGSPMTQCIRLEASPCRFGGVRWLALCPNTGRRVAHLYRTARRALSPRLSPQIQFAAGGAAGSVFTPQRQGAREIEDG
jgi:hypothetical protein